MRAVRFACGVGACVVAVGSAVLLFMVILRGRVDENAVAAVPPPALSTVDATDPPPVTVLLLRAETTARHFASVPGAAADAYDRRVDAWRRRLERAGARVRLVDETALVTALAPGVVVVAPSAAALHDDTIARLTAAVDAGTGLIATWAFGVYGPEGGWRGYEALGALVGAVALAGPNGADAPRYLALHGQTSVTAGLPAGARLEIQPYDRPLPLTSAAAVADYVDWTMLAGDGPRQTAVARASRGTGRVVWINFEPDAVIGGVGAERADRLVDNALAWAARAPRGDLETWPDGARAAAAIGLDAEQDFEKGETIAERLAASAMPFTSFVLTKLADAHPGTVRALAATSELASHTHDHRPLAEQDEDAQRTQLVTSRAVLATLTGREVKGLRPPEEQTNAETLSALADTGYHWVVGWRDKDRAEPWIAEAHGKAVVVLPRIPHDDYEYVVRRPATDTATAWASMRSDLQQVRRLGGFYFFDFHTQFWDAAAIRTGVQHLTGLRNLPGVWLATVGDVAAWWRLRSRAAVRVRRVAEDAIEVELVSGTAAPRMGVNVYLPDDPRAWRVEGMEGEPPVLTVRAESDDAVRLEYRDVAAGYRRIARLRRG